MTWSSSAGSAAGGPADAAFSFSFSGPQLVPFFCFFVLAQASGPPFRNAPPRPRPVGSATAQICSDRNCNPCFLKRFAMFFLLEFRGWIASTETRRNTIADEIAAASHCGHYRSLRIVTARTPIGGRCTSSQKHHVGAAPGLHPFEEDTLSQIAQPRQRKYAQGPGSQHARCCAAGPRRAQILKSARPWPTSQVTHSNATAP